MKHSIFGPIMVVTIVFGLLLGVLISTAPQGYAQDSFTPVPDVDVANNDDYTYDDPARVENGEAEWALNETQFINNYPDGFTFMGNATSTGGKLASVSVFFSSVGKEDYEIRQRGEVNPETGQMRVVVEGTDADGIPPWVPINYRWRITDESGTIYYSEWILGAEYADTTRQWTRLETNDALVFIQEGLPTNIADVMFEKLAQKREEYLRVFGEPLSYSPRIILFADQTAFQEWRSFEAGAGGTIIVGQAFGERGTIVQFLFQNETAEELANTVVHEVTHLYQFDKYEFRAVGWWIEGEATFFEFAPDYDYAQRVRNYAILDQLPRLFVDFGPIPNSAGPDGRGRWGYDVGYTFYRFMVERFGYETLNQLVQLLAEPEELAGFEVDEHFKASLEAVTGQSVDTLERQWRVWLGAPEDFPTLIPTPTIAFNFPPTVTPFGQ
ncbi:MAG: hypothetical protein CUN55_02095 [Phototrophicales bacterium]|nr:MAG: hypothetical protein CUN55_02095 [Phototrophicales bacterium]